MKTREKGFTLIELMIVVAIIGILAAVAIPKFADLVTKSKEASLKGTLGAVRSAISIYYGDSEGTNPANLFTSLTTANKYMPQVNNTPSLGKYVVPGVSAQSNAGHVGGLYDNASAAAAVITSPNPLNDTSPLYYGSTEGIILVGCSHKDTKGTSWSTY